ncbi:MULTISPECIES: phosphate ABC transporter substrate-binding protein [Vibrio]|uniref:Phosphate ABC transporter substrate-binding protein n=1 Tax=Vibrio algicola TaxID=2662262 RepID=A0A5Q0TK82_9VIBR|nr:MULTISPECIES: phosphate ABC transporter substrate-binding protein [Vibrio]MBD1576468.1 phosphate ABC transporter substrate-binding protein [Vibrio sp. S11_S32]
MLRVLLTGLLSSLIFISNAYAKDIVVSGSSSVTRVMDVLAESYNKTHPESYIAVQGVDSTAGIILATKGVADLGMSSRYLTEAELRKDLTITTIAHDGLAIATNIANPVSNLTREQLAKIYQGEITNWKQVGGEDKGIAVVTREASSGSRYSFESLLGLTRVVNNQLVSNISPKILVVNSNGMMKTLINNNPQAIGFVSMGSLDKSIKAVDFNGVDPTSANIANGDYKLSRPFLVVQKKDHKDPSIESFLGFITSNDGQKIITDYGYTPAKK